MSNFLITKAEANLKYWKTRKPRAKRYKEFVENQIKETQLLLDRGVAR
jgi:hypothetical protein